MSPSIFLGLFKIWKLSNIYHCEQLKLCIHCWPSTYIVQMSSPCKTGPIHHLFMSNLLASDKIRNFTHCDFFCFLLGEQRYARRTHSWICYEDIVITWLCFSPTWSCFAHGKQHCNLRCICTWTWPLSIDTPLSKEIGSDTVEWIRDLIRYPERLY